MKKVIFFIFLFSFFLRTYHLTLLPRGFHEDEAYVGYNAYSLLKTGRDHNGKFLPLSIDQFGDFRPSGLHFLTVPFVALFGLSVFATRLPPALFGSLSIFLIYLLSLQFYKNKFIALVASAFLAVTPWHIIASRSTSESIVALFFVLLGMYVLLQFFTTPNRRVLHLGVSCALFFCSFLFYHASRIFVPGLLIYIACLIWFRNHVSIVQKKQYLGACIALLVLLVALFLSSHGGARLSEVSIFSSPTTKLLLENRFMEDGRAGLPVTLTRLIHGRIALYSEVFFDHYLAHFSPDFLYLKGGYPERYMVPSTGALSLVEGIFFIFGMGFLFCNLIKHKDKLLSWEMLPLMWLLLGPIPAAITDEDIPHFQRSIMMLPAVTMIAAYGVSRFMQSFKEQKFQRVILLLTGMFLLYSFGVFYDQYFVHGLVHRTTYKNGQGRSEGVQELVESIRDISKSNGSYQVVETSRNENRLIFYLFFNKIDPFYYQKLGSPRQHDGMKFDNILFTDDFCPEITAATPSALIYVNAGDEWCKKKKPSLTTLKDIRQPDGSVIFTILQAK